MVLPLYVVFFDVLLYSKFWVAKMHCRSLSGPDLMGEEGRNSMMMLCKIQELCHPEYILICSRPRIPLIVTRRVSILACALQYG